MATASVNGAQLHYEESGQGKPLLFIHGMCGDASVWAGQVERLSPRFHCVAYDRRGHSRSSLGQVGQRTVELHADDAAQLIIELGLAPCTVVGSSGGARVAVDLVRRYPRLIERAVFSEPPLMALDPEGFQAFARKLKPAMDAALARGDDRAAVDAFFEIMCPGLWAVIPEERRDVPYRANAAELIGDLTMPQYQVSRADLAEIRTLSLVIRGTESMPLMRNIAAILAESLPNARLVELEGSGHVTYAERPAEFAAAVESFALAQAI
ncbi:MAG TPA: alpha/beta hydrolase [Ktedonobacterales bacterium]|jgi:pimeloyl-ACP methyl ester carboxylesterase|nr:alpha/beta hydrolase [Ktedonobacterales bacterium]